MNNEKLTRDYRCAQCWGMLVEKYIAGAWVVVCAKDPAHDGIVTESWVEHRRKTNVLEAAEVGSRYAKILGLKRPDLKAASQALYGDE